jgi:nicotinamide-nucleotide amidase|tara:strand:+ start:2994 stop:4274 length:1281 start_codon:yes stop_codon:yes gene_type:complete
MSDLLGEKSSLAVIIAVGSELLTPDKIDTNSLFLTEELNGIGFTVTQKIVVGDDALDLESAFRYSCGLASLVLITGGLGPTEDDLTRDVIASVLGRPLEIDKTILEDIRKRFAERNLRMPEINRRQAEVPRGAEILINQHGTAPGLILKEKSVTTVLLPGPPRELRPIFTHYVAPRLKTMSLGRRVYRRVLRTTGETESFVDEGVKPICQRWLNRSIPIRTTILASLGQIDLHLSAVSDDQLEAKAMLDDATRELREELGILVFSEDGRSLPEVVGGLLLQHGATVGVAESCTGGLIVSRLTDYSGASAYVSGGITTYSNEAKVKLLDVSGELLERYGAVSEEVAIAMALGVQRNLETQFGVSATGIAGPGGAVAGKPVGTVYVALVDSNGDIMSRRCQLPGDRSRVKFQTSQVVLNLLRKKLLSI